MRLNPGWWNLGNIAIRGGKGEGLEKLRGRLGNRDSPAGRQPVQDWRRMWIFHSGWIHVRPLSTCHKVAAELPAQDCAVIHSDTSQKEREMVPGKHYRRRFLVCWAMERDSVSGVVPAFQVSSWFFSVDSWATRILTVEPSSLDPIKLRYWARLKAAWSKWSWPQMSLDEELTAKVQRGSGDGIMMAGSFLNLFLCCFACLCLRFFVFCSLAWKVKHSIQPSRANTSLAQCRRKRC